MCSEKYALLLCLLPSLAVAQVTQGPPRIRNVYIPADQLQLLFDSSSQGVLMPRDKILDLWEKAQLHSPSETAPPTDAVVTRAAYEAQLDAHELRITGRIQIAKLRGGWQAIELPFGGLAIESARVGDQPARFGRRDDGTLFLVLEEVGPFELQLEMSVPLASKGGDLAATLKLPPVPATEIQIQLAEDKQLLVGETTLHADRTDRGQQTFRVAVDPTGLVPLVIADRSASGNRTPLVLVHSRLIGRIEPAGLRWEGVLDLDVYARPTDAFQLRLTAAVDVAEVEAPELSQWTIREQADGTALVALAFRKPFLGRRAVRLLGLAPAPLAAEWNVPTVAVLEAASHVGQVSLTASPSLQVDVGALAGIRPERLSHASPDSSPADANAPLTFTFWDEDFRLPLRVTERRRTVQASVATLLEVNRTGVVLRGSVRVEPRHAPLFDVRMLLPREWEVTSVLFAGQAAAWESVPQASPDPAVDPWLQTVRFGLQRPLSPGQTLDISVTAQRQSEDWLQGDDAFSELALPELRLDGADEVEGTVLVQAPPDIELLVSGLSDDLQPMAADGSTGNTARTAGTALQYRYQDDARVSGRLQVRTKPAKVSAETLAFVRLDRGKLDVHCQIDLHIRQGTVRQIRWTLPAAVGEKIQIATVDSPARVIEQRHTLLPNADDADGELFLWQIILDQPVAGRLSVALDFGESFSAPTAIGRTSESSAEESASPQAGISVIVPVLALQNVSRQSGMVAVEAADDQQVAFAAGNLRDLDPADVFQGRAYVPSERIVAAYQYPRLPYRLTLSATRHTSEPVLAAICESAEIVSVAGPQGRMRHQARFSVRGPGLQYVPVKLPDSADLWSVMLDNEPVEVRRSQDRYLVPVPAAQADSASETRELTLVYETDIPRFAAKRVWERLSPQTLRQKTPELAMPVLGTTWYIHPPEGTDWVSTDGEFRPETLPARSALVTRLAASIAHHSTSGLPWKIGGLVAAGIFVGLFALVRTGNKGGFSVVELLVVIAIIGVLVALLLPATQSAREAARRTQCHNNLKSIGLALHNYHETYGQFPPATIGPGNVPRDRQFSWMVAILPFLEQRNLYGKLRLELPWDDPQNLSVLQSALPGDLFCPSEVQRMTGEGYAKTSYVAITGAAPSPEFRTSRGIIGFDRGLRMEEITDGTSNTAIVAEVTDGGPWFAGGPGTARRIDDWIARKPWSQHPGGGIFLFADGSVQFITPNVDSQTLRRLAIAQDGQTVKLDDSGGAYSRARSDTGSATPPPASSLEGEPPAEMDKEAKEEREEEVIAERLTPAPATPEDKPAALAPPTPTVQRDDRARLSLRVALERPEGEAIRFRRDGGTGELVIGLQDHTLASTLQWLIVAAAVLAAWTWRQTSGRRHGIAVVLGLAVPIGLSGLVSPAWTPLLDGLLLGTLAGACLWILLGIMAAARPSVPRAAATATGTATAIGIGLLLAAGVSIAEEPRPAAKTPIPLESALSHVPAGEQGPPHALKGEPQPGQPGLTLYVPYDPDRDKPLQNTQIYLPHDEFLRLWNQAHPDEPKPWPPDVPAMVSHAVYSGQLQNDVARFAGRLLIHQFAEGWARVALPLGDVALEQIEINGQAATLAGADSATAGSASRPVQSIEAELGKDARPASAAPDVRPAIYLDEPGSHVVDLRFSVPVNRLGATGQLAVPLRQVSAGLLRFQLPADELDVQVSGCSGGWRRHGPEPDDAGTPERPGAKRPDESTAPAAAAETAGSFVSIPLGANNDVSIRWQPRRVEAREGHLIGVDHALRIDVLDSGIHLHSQFHYRIQQGAVRELQLRIPPDVAIQRVDGAEVADWSVETDPIAEPDGETQRLVIALKADLTTGADLDVHAFCRDRQVTGTIGIHALEPLGVVRETGRIAIGCASHFRVRVGQTDRIDQIDRTGLELPPSSRAGCAFLSAYRYTARPWRLQLEIERYQPRVEVTDRTAVAVTARQATMRSLLTAEVTGAPIAAFAVRLPAALRVAQVRVPSAADWFLERDDRGQRLRVKLSEPATGKLDLALTGTIARDATQTEFTVPGVTVEDAQFQRGQLAIYLDDDLDAILSDDRGVRPLDPAALDSELRPDSGPPVRYAFRYDSPPDGLRLQLSPAPPRLNGDVTTVVSVREGAVAYISQVTFEIRQAGLSRFQVVTPPWLGDDLELQGDQIRQIRSRIADGGRLWDIELQQPVRGTYRLHLMQTLPLPDDGTVSAAVVWPLDVERSRGHVILENGTADELAAATMDGAVPIPIADVPEGVADAVRRQAIAAYRIHGDAAVLTWQRRVREQDIGLKATIPLADLTTVIQADGRYRARAAYNIRNRTLQFLELELPPDSHVWSVHVSEQPVRPATLHRQGRPITLLPLQKTSAGDFSSKVVVVYSGQLGAPLHRWTQVRPPAPQIVSDVPVSRTLWTVCFPPEYQVHPAKRGSNLELVAAAYQHEERKLSFLDEMREIVQVAGTKGKSAARSKAWDNLKKIDLTLQDYAEGGAQVAPQQAAVVREQAQQVESEIRRLEELRPDTKRADLDAAYYFGPLRRGPEEGPEIADPVRDLEELPESDMPRADRDAPEDKRKELPDQAPDGPEERRGDLRKQAAEQLAKLRAMQQQEGGQQQEAAPSQPAKPPESERERTTADLPQAVEEQIQEPLARDAEPAPGPPEAAAQTGRLSLDLDFALVGTAYHFRKLHGDPRLVLDARHESLTRTALALIWAGLCLALAMTITHILKRPNAAALARRYWPWLAALAGIAWLFLLPAGACGLVLLVTALCVLVRRVRQQRG